jgi:hypothetical protein
MDGCQTKIQNYLDKIVCTREQNNQKGADADFEQVVPRVHSPVKFKLQRKREIYHARDGAMHGIANENRFMVINDIPANNTKYTFYTAPGFEKAADHSIDEYLRSMSNSANETAAH